MELIDTHCHVHWPDFGIPADEVIKNADDADVKKLICIGTDYKDSQIAVKFANTHKNVWASVGVHPHDAKNSADGILQIGDLAKESKVVAIGECGLDYYYDKSPHDIQKDILVSQLELAQKTGLPVIFHVRDAYSDFWPIVDKFTGIKGVFHCFSATIKELDEVLKRDFYVGLNGIVTFSKDPAQINAFKAVPLDKMLLETDAPFLTPVPFRGKINESKNVKVIAEFLSNLRGESLEDFAAKTTANANKLFKIDD